jgi:ferric-dicitrate binding protein FerR (iron transport regulator)
MNNYIDMNDVEQLIIDKLTGQIGKEAEFRLEELIARNQEVEQLWQQMQQVYAMRKAVSFDQSFNAEAAWLALQQKVNIPDTTLPPATDTVAMPERKPTNRWLRYAMAATVTGIIIIAVYFFSSLYRTPATGSKYIQIQLANGNIVLATTQDSLAALMRKAREANVDPGAWNTLTVPAGKNYSFELADGSKVWMNAASELKFPLLFTRPERNVELKGEAYFKVAHQVKQPFVVRVNGLSVKALGTEFNIKSYNNEQTCIALVTGSVIIENARGQQIVLSPGESVVVENGNSSLHAQKFDETIVLGWMQGLYFFRNEKLQQIAVVAQRWFDVPVKLNDPALGDLHFSGALDRNKPINTFFNMLASSGDIRYEWKDGEIVISRN